jgi:hypothetical protein
MATTVYTITAGDNFEVEVGTATKKAKASELALAYRDEHKVAVRIATGAGNVVAELAAPKKIKMIAPYTRVVAVDHEEIKGMCVAYKRTRVGFALLDSGRGNYHIYDLDRRVLLDGVVEVSTTREAGRWFADEAPALRAQIVAQGA